MIFKKSKTGIYIRELPRDWNIVLEPHGNSFFGGFIVSPSIVYYSHHQYYQLFFGWLKWTISITVFNSNRNISHKQ